MEISELTLKLIILLIPGAIGSIILERLTVHKPWSPFRFIVNAIIIGFFSYLSLQVVCSVVVWLIQFTFSNHYYTPLLGKGKLSFWNSLNNSTTIPYIEVLFSILASIIIGLFLTKADSYKWLNRFAQKNNISHKYGDENLYTYFLWLDKTDYVYVRYIKNNLTYCGYVRSFSETDEFKEIVLKEVTVYSYDESELLYEIDSIYLCMSKEDVIIELAKRNNNEQSEDSEQQLNENTGQEIAE